jgi:hypothetical protein
LAHYHNGALVILRHKKKQWVAGRLCASKSSAHYFGRFRRSYPADYLFGIVGKLGGAWVRRIVNSENEISELEGMELK